MSKRRVTYYYDPDIGSYTYGAGHAMKPQRMRITHELVSAYGMLPKMHVLRAKRATPETMTRFHTDEYIDFLSKVTRENASKLTFSSSRFLVGEDNPPFEGVFEFCSISAGGSVAAAERVMSGRTDIAINWAGGLHHAKKREASGFCYVNDIVLAILEMLRTVPRVLYIDIDVHHGDGVEEAFYTTDRVMTCSFHKFGDFFPGTGMVEDLGRGKGRGYAVNVPLKDGITDEAYKSVFEPVIDKILEVFRPSVIVLQCGADSLSGDKLGGLNLTLEGHARCVQYIRDTNIPLLLLGGGGYTVKNVARAWTYETACALSIENEIDRNLPWNEYFEWFGPRYRLEVLESNNVDDNVTDGSLKRIRDAVLKGLSELQPAPSVQLQDVPRESIGQHLGIGSVHEQQPTDELDERLAQNARFVYGLQDSLATDSDHESEEPSDNGGSDDSTPLSRTRSGGGIRGAGQPPRKRMSILTNQFIDPTQDVWANATTGAGLATGAKRRFFQSDAHWDDTLKTVVVERERCGVNAKRPAIDLDGLRIAAPLLMGDEDRRSRSRDVEMDEDGEVDELDDD